MTEPGFPCFFSAETDGHDPRFFLKRGQVAQNEERPQRAHLLRQALHQAGLTTAEPPRTDRAAMAQVHSARYLDFLSRVWDEWQAFPDHGPEIVANLHPQKDRHRYPSGIVGQAGWHMADTACPIGPGSHHAALRSVDCAIAAAQALAEGAGAAYALCRPPGHHANADTAGGHCLLNNAAIAAQHLRGHFDRVAILDIDVHHGNGTQEIFYDRADVLTVSIHAAPDAFYPFYLGYADETGAGTGAGFNLNLPLPIGSGDQVWLGAIRQGLARIAAFAPDRLVLSLGLDAHERDPLRGLAVTTPAFTQAASMIRNAGLPTAIIQEGGYLSDDLALNMAAFLDGWLGR
ncbi:histone deacetylase family protein [Paracoccus sp. M683]|uniref:histone deacetylase family protein n=1 Tax=Paracoccus sp. M683 TaxID=2594268 RepID=UPI00117F266C|nr:histone deacetylase family protein [Paracoccus sp. M683]TRW96005.1 histone deacetylase family protein [Paracoccus sp. M683]